MLRCYVEGRNLVNGTPKTYKISEGAVFIENYNETLDSGTIILPQLNSKIEIEPLDIIVVIGGNIENRRLCVDSFNCVQTSLNPVIYKYEISLCSETKLLEGILLPNLKITKIYNNPRKIYDYLDNYNNEYGPKIYNGTDYVSKWTFSDKLINRFNNVECPELQWNQPTLREVFNDLLMVDDCIVVLRNNIIDYIDISEVGSDVVDLTNINYIQESRSSADYVSELKMNISNALNNSMPTGPVSSYTDADLPADTNKIIENIGFRNSDSYLLTTENMRLQTSFPIWRLFYCDVNLILPCTIYYDTPGGSHLTLNTNLDITLPLKDTTYNYILEYSEWLTKDVFYGAWGSVSGLSSDYRNTCLYFTRGQKNIENFNDKYSTDLLFIHTDNYVFTLLAKHPEANNKLMLAAQQYLDDNNYQGTVTSVDAGNPDYKTATFKVAYEAIDDCVFMTSKSPFSRNKRQVVDNQTGSYVDIQKQGILEYLKANRLGNTVSLINGRYKEESDMPVLSQKINNKIIFRKEISVYNRYIDVNYQATENYVLQDYFTSVKSKLRSWKVVSGSDALLRADLIKFYVNNTIESISNEDMIIPSYNNAYMYIEDFHYCVIQFNTNSGTRPVNPKYNGTTQDLDAIMVEFTKHIVGNSAVFTIRMQDNYFAGTYVSNYSGTDGRVEQKGIGYTDDNGEITGGTIYFYDYQNNPAKTFANKTVERAIKPYTKINNYLEPAAKIPFEIRKDNGEILQISIQFEVNSDANDIFIGKIF